MPLFIFRQFPPRLFLEKQSALFFDKNFVFVKKKEKKRSQKRAQLGQQPGWRSIVLPASENGDVSSTSNPSENGDISSTSKDFKFKFKAFENQVEAFKTSGDVLRPDLAEAFQCLEDEVTAFKSQMEGVREAAEIAEVIAEINRLRDEVISLSIYFKDDSDSDP